MSALQPANGSAMDGGWARIANLDPTQIDLQFKLQVETRFALIGFDGGGLLFQTHNPNSFFFT